MMDDRPQPEGHLPRHEGKEAQSQDLSQHGSGVRGEGAPPDQPETDAEVEDLPQPEGEMQFDGLPPRPDPATWIAEVPDEPVPDTTGGRDVSTDSMLRHAGF